MRQPKESFSRLIGSKNFSKTNIGFSIKYQRRDFANKSQLSETMDFGGYLAICYKLAQPFSSFGTSDFFPQEYPWSLNRAVGKSGMTAVCLIRRLGRGELVGRANLPLKLQNFHLWSPKFFFCCLLTDDLSFCWMRLAVEPRCT